jgi:hypothetical protein
VRAYDSYQRAEQLPLAMESVGEALALPVEAPRKAVSKPQ